MLDFLRRLNHLLSGGGLSLDYVVRVPRYSKDVQTFSVTHRNPHSFLTGSVKTKDQAMVQSNIPRLWNVRPPGQRISYQTAYSIRSGKQTPKGECSNTPET